MNINKLKLLIKKNIKNFNNLSNNNINIIEYNKYIKKIDEYIKNNNIQDKELLYLVYMQKNIISFLINKNFMNLNVSILLYICDRSFTLKSNEKIFLYKKKKFFNDIIYEAKLVKEAKFMEIQFNKNNRIFIKLSYLYNSLIQFFFNMALMHKFKFCIYYGYISKYELGWDIDYNIFIENKTKNINLLLNNLNKSNIYIKKYIFIEKNNNKQILSDKKILNKTTGAYIISKLSDNVNDIINIYENLSESDKYYYKHI